MKKVYLFILFVLFSTQITLAQSYQFTKVADLQYAMGVVFNSDNEMYYFSQSAGLFDETGTNLLTDAQTGHSFGCIGVENETIWTGGYWGVTEYNAGSYTSYTSIPGVSNPAFYDIDYHQNNVYAAIEDDGLGYFNGIEWKVYTSSDGLTASWFTSVTHDDSGKIYIAGVNGSWNEGIIDMFDGSIWSSFTIADHGLDMILNVFV
ncbi:MAG: hypothetical protein KAS62_02995, partial [Candidatus Delongbacteria bacterium]|nr:hypothetical protein [Candidatus Delongbacteria bacterium]